MRTPCAKLPLELTRAGRFDERFFVDLPTTSEREQITEIHLTRFGCPVNGLVSHIAEQTQGWTGAEIEQLVKSAARRSGRKPTKEIVTLCASDIKPITKVRAGEVDALRAWASTTLRLANAAETSEAAPTAKRKLTRSNPTGFDISLN